MFIEELTWGEVRDDIGAGKTTAIYVAGSTGQNGLRLVLRKHNTVSRYIAERIARELGSALVYPVMPFAPAGDPTARRGHIRYPGTVSLSEEAFASVARGAALSAIAAGFKSELLFLDRDNVLVRKNRLDGAVDVIRRMLRRN